MESGSQPFVDYYMVLEVKPEDGLDTIKKAYKRLILKHHPDKGGDQAKFVEIQKAYEVLSDSAARVAFDLRRKSRGGFREPKEESDSSWRSHTRNETSSGESSSSNRHTYHSEPKMNEQTRRGPRCGWFGCPDHESGEIPCTMESALKMLRSHQRNVARLQLALMDAYEFLSPDVYYKRPGNKLSTGFTKVLDYLDYMKACLDSWEAREFRVLSEADWGHSCDDFVMIVILKRMRKDLRGWSEFDMPGVQDICERVRRAYPGPGFGEYRHNCFIDLEVRLAGWPCITWNIGFPLGAYE